MNKKQRAVIWIGIFLVAFVGSVHIDKSHFEPLRLLFFWAMVGIVGSGLFFLFKETGGEKPKTKNTINAYLVLSAVLALALGLFIFFSFKAVNKNESTVLGGKIYKQGEIVFDDEQLPQKTKKPEDIVLDGGTQ